MGKTTGFSRKEQAQFDRWFDGIKVPEGQREIYRDVLSATVGEQGAYARMAGCKEFDKREALDLRRSI